MVNTARHAEHAALPAAGFRPCLIALSMGAGQEGESWLSLVGAVLWV